MGAKLTNALSRLGRSESGLTPEEVRAAFQAAEADFNSYVAEHGAPLQKQVDRMTETVEVLAGTRNVAASAKAAVRRQDLAPFSSLPVNMKSKPATGAVTAAQFNDLRDDVRKLHEMLRNLALIAERKTI
jgi:hypothetical protein